MFFASIGVSILGLIALVVGWKDESNPATFLAMGLIVVAAGLFVASLVQDRRRATRAAGTRETS